MINDLLLKNVYTKIEKLNPNFKKLWTNSKPTEDFEAQTIKLSSSGYDMLIFIYNLNWNSSNQTVCSSLGLKGYNTELAGVAPDGSTTYRNCTYVSDTEYSIGEGHIGSTIQNRRCVPLMVIGFNLTF